MLNSKVKEILRSFCEGDFIVLSDPEPALNASIQKTPALAAVLLRDGQVFSALKPELSAEPSAILALAPQDNSEASSALEFHLALLDPDDENSILILTQGLSAESQLWLVFPSETSLSVAKQCFNELCERLMTSQSPQPVLMDFPGCVCAKAGRRAQSPGKQSFCTRFSSKLHFVHAFTGTSPALYSKALLVSGVLIKLTGIDQLYSR